MMAKQTTKPLTIWIAAYWKDSAWVQALRDAGHTVEIMYNDTPDLILHPSAHMWSDAMSPMIDIAVRAARERRYAAKS